jgi:hypothetical protein
MVQIQVVVGAVALGDTLYSASDRECLGGSDCSWTTSSLASSIANAPHVSEQ